MRNTEWCYGVAVYTGHQTKVMKNALKSRAKKSKIELQTNTYIIYTVLVQFIVCITSAAYDCLWIKSTGQYIPYLGYSYTINQNENTAF